MPDLNRMAETQALGAVLEGDESAAREILEDFYPTELDGLYGKLEDLSRLIDEVRRGKSAR